MVIEWLTELSQNNSCPSVSIRDWHALGEIRKAKGKVGKKQ